MTAVEVPSPLLTRPGAVAAAADSPDTGVAWHYGDPFAEQRAAATGVAVVDRSHRPVLTVTGRERLSWLHTIISQHVAGLSDGQAAESLDLDVQGRILHHFVLTELNETVWIDTEPPGQTLLDFLSKMVFWADAKPAPAAYAVLTVLGPAAATLLPVLGVDALPPVNHALALRGGGFLRSMPWPATGAVDVVIPRDQLPAWWDKLTAAGASAAGMWAFEALRVAAVRPRAGVDTDARAIPHEVRWIGGPDEYGAVHLDKGCYRGQETVARVHNLGKPPRQLVLLHLDGSADGRPVTGDDVLLDGRPAGRLGTVVDHFELGPIALALVKRTVAADAQLTAGPCAAAIDPASVPVGAAPQAGRMAITRLRQGQ